MTKYNKNDCRIYQSLVRASSSASFQTLINRISNPSQKAKAQEELDHYTQQNEELRAKVEGAFDKALSGDDAAKYELAETLSWVSSVTPVCYSLISDLDKIKEITKAQVLDICMELSTRNHPQACLLAANTLYWNMNDHEAAVKLLLKAESLGVNTPQSQNLRSTLGLPTTGSSRKPPKPSNW
jgi:hypothetical protein